MMKFKMLWNLDVIFLKTEFCVARGRTFAQREFDVITARPIQNPKTLRAFASVHRKPTKLGSILLRRTQ